MTRFGKSLTNRNRLPDFSKDLKFMFYQSTFGANAWYMECYKQTGQPEANFLVEKPML